MHTSPTASLGQNGNGGLNVYVREVASSFSERGIATDIFTRRQTPDDPAIEALAPLSRVIYLPAGKSLDKYSLYNEVPAFAAGIRSFADREQIEYDLLYSHYWLSGEVACLLRPGMAAGWAHIAHTLGLVKNRTLASGARPEPALRIRVEGEVAQQADLLIASTTDEAEDLIQSYKADPERVYVVAPGIDLGTFQPLDRADARRKVGYGPGRLLLFVGRLERLKGVETAIQALALLRDRAHDDLRLIVLGEDVRDGDESEKERLKAVASALGVRDRVDFLGSVAHHELPYFYAAADVCVMPSYSESFGLVALEAQACGRPVVASGVSGLRSVVRDEVSGYLIDGHDPAAYAERIGRLLADPELAQQMGRRGRLLAQRFSWTRTADRLEGLFENVIERSHARVQAGVRHE
ncbi:MAG TPA: glycosyltransferase [Candidatus Limnocylindria bacterium]|nr:glycosyltransferase [Candidatus Limnocylindria bacterium]